MENNPFAAYPIYLKASDIMDALQVSRAKAYEIMNDSRCPTVTIGKNKRVQRDRFFEFILGLEGKTVAG